MPFPRRAFLKSAASALPVTALHDLLGQSPAPAPTLHPVAAGKDRLGSTHSLGFSSLAFKLLPEDSGGNLFVIEHTHLTPGGPALHLHLSQDEWFYVMEGEVVFQVGDQRAHLKPGESVLAPRRIPHTFSSTTAESRLLIAFTPAGKMRQYFVDAESNPSLASKPEFINRYEMQWIGPSPFWKS